MPSSIPLKAGESPIGQQLYGKHRGGTLTVYDHEDFEHFDPGEAYGGEDYTVLYAIERPALLLSAQYRDQARTRRRGRPTDASPTAAER